MKLSEATIKELAQIITGGYDMAPLYRSGPTLVSFFNSFGAKEEYSRGFPSRWYFTEEMLRKFNNSNVIAKIILAAINPVHFGKDHPIEKTVQHLNRFLIADGYIIIEDTNRQKHIVDRINNLSGSLSADTLGDFLKRYKIVQADTGPEVTPETLATLSHEFIAQQIQKSRDKL